MLIFACWSRHYSSRDDSMRFIYALGKFIALHILGNRHFYSRYGYAEDANSHTTLILCLVAMNLTSCPLWIIMDIVLVLSIIVEKKNCNDTRIIVCNINDPHISSTAYTILYKLIVERHWSDCGGWELIDTHGTGTFVCQLETGRGISTGSCTVGNVFLMMTSGLVQILTRIVW